jgi:hypothetical protein
MKFTVLNNKYKRIKKENIIVNENIDLKDEYIENEKENIIVNENIDLKDQYIENEKYKIIDKNERTEITNIFNNYMSTIILYNNLSIKIRKPPFPSEISETLVCSLLWKIKQIKTNPNSIRYNKSTGDLTLQNKKNIEVKCFSSDGPMSFGPITKWNSLCIVDALNYINNDFKVYFVNAEDTDNIWNQIKINKKTSFNEAKKTGILPRLNPSNLINQLTKFNKITLMYQGTFEDAIN